MKAKDIASQLGSLAAAASSQPGNYDSNDIEYILVDNNKNLEIKKKDKIFLR